MLIMNVCSRCSTAAAESEFVNGARVDFDVFFFLLSIDCWSQRERERNASSSSTERDFGRCCAKLARSFHEVNDLIILM